MIAADMLGWTVLGIMVAGATIYGLARLAFDGHWHILPVEEWWTCQCGGRICIECETQHRMTHDTF